MEEQLKTELRRREHTLSIIGLGVILFGLWSIIRVSMEFMLNPALMQGMVRDFMEGLDPSVRKEVTVHTAKILMYTMVLVFLLIEMGFRLYIGRSAMVVGRGKNKRGFYLVAASFLCMLYIVSFILYAATFFIPSRSGISLSDRFVYIVIDATSVITLADMVISGIQVRILRKKLM